MTDLHSAQGEVSRERRMHIVQGEFAVSDDPDVMMTTILGSCVAACFFDPHAKVGGMNHFLLPGVTGQTAGLDGLRYGVHSMELLLNGLYRMGARRDRLEAKLFGGARMIDGLTDVGLQNADFAEDFMRKEGIKLTASSLRGDHARRIQFWPASGRMRQMTLTEKAGAVFESERGRARPAPVPAAAQGGALELF